MKGKVLVTGIDGFIGRHLGASLVRCGYHVVGLGRRPRSPVGRGRGFHEYHPIDALQPGSRLSRLKGVDFVIHLAAVTQHAEIVRDPLRALNTDLGLLLPLAKLYAQSKGRNFIYPSSGKVYGRPVYLPLDERHPLNPTTFLGKFKRMGEEILEYLSLASGKTVTVLRIFNAYGPGQKNTFLIPKLLKHAREGTVVRIGNMNDARDYVYIDDLIDAFRAAMERNLDGFNVFNVGSGKSYTARHLTRLIRSIPGTDLDARPDPAHRRPCEPRNETAGIAAFRRLGWKPLTDIQAGLRRTMDSLPSA